MTASTTKSSEPDIDEATRLALFRSMLEMRHMEKRAYDLFLQNLVKGTSHLFVAGPVVVNQLGTETVPVASDAVELQRHHVHGCAPGEDDVHASPWLWRAKSSSNASSADRTKPAAPSG